jgi:two-component system sensor histidine kinase EvgS
MIKPLGLAVLARRLSALLTSTAEDSLPSEVPDETLAPIEDWVDSTVIEQIVAGDATLEAKLLDTITHANRESLAVLQRAVESDDRLRFCGALHHMAGALRIIGARSLVEACRYAEQQSMDDGLPLGALLAGIAADVERLNETLDRRVKVLSAIEAGKEPADFS